MNSFDVFDTLIARRYFKSNSIWRQMAKEFDIPDFENIRPITDDGTRSFQEIYNELVRRGLITDNQKVLLMQREIELEINNCYGIKNNIDKVQDGDLLITDMYLPAQVILQMVRSAGLNRQVTIYQSNQDKGSGKIWNILKNNPPDCHIGDNQHSDINLSKCVGINSLLYNQSNYTEIEQFLISKDLWHLAHLIREVRLRNNFDCHIEYFNLSCQYNLPLIFIMSELLCRSISNDITFLGRDCQLLWRVFNNYYRIAYYLPFSRRVAYDNPVFASRYLQLNTGEDSTLVDISSTGQTWTFLYPYGIRPIKALIYSDSEYRPNLPNIFSYITQNSICGETNIILEIMNCADHGVLDAIEFIDERITITKFDTPELPKELIQAIHQPVKDAINLATIYRESLRDELTLKSNEFLHQIFRYLSQEICSKSHLAQSIPNFIEREYQYHQEIIHKRMSK